MKRQTLAFPMCLVMAVALIGCGSSKNIDGVWYETYGLLNKDQVRDPMIHYELAVGNVFLGVIFCETIIVPIYVFGFDLYEPIGLSGRKTS